MELNDYGYWRGDQMIKDFVAVTGDKGLNTLLVEIYESNNDPQLAVWTMVNEVGIKLPFDPNQFPQPFTISNEDDGPILQWPALEDTTG